MIARTEEWIGSHGAGQLGVKQGKIVSEGGVAKSIFGALTREVLPVLGGALAVFAASALFAGSVSAQPQAAACHEAQCAPILVYVGSRAEGAGRGIVVARFDPKTRQFSAPQTVADVPMPRWLVPSADGSTLYAVTDDKAIGSSLLSYRIDRATGMLTPIGKATTGGAGATHFQLDAASRTALIAHYGDGKVSALPLGPNGALDAASSVQQNTGAGPHPRQGKPHAHGVALAPGGRDAIVADLGADRVFVYRFDPKSRRLTPGDPAFVAMPPASGPRHLAILPNRPIVYVNSELTAEITRFRWDVRKRALGKIGTISTTAKEYAGTKSSGEMALSPDGRFLYATNRGEDSIVTYAVTGRDGALSEIQRLPAGGKTPWAFNFDPAGRWMFVANEASNAVTAFARDPKSGRLTATGTTLTVANPVSVAALSR